MISPTPAAARPRPQAHSDRRWHRAPASVIITPHRNSQTMSEEQVKAADADAAKEEEEVEVEEISDEDLEGVAGGIRTGAKVGFNYDVRP